jgi:hypothetical protein
MLLLALDHSSCLNNLWVYRDFDKQQNNVTLHTMDASICLYVLYFHSLRCSCCQGALAASSTIYIHTQHTRNANTVVDCAVTVHYFQLSLLNRTNTVHACHYSTAAAGIGERSHKCLNNHTTDCCTLACTA